MLDIGLFTFYGLFAIAILAAVAFWVIDLIRIPGAFLRALVGVGSILVLFGLAYALSDGSVSAKAATQVGPQGARLISAGLILFYITLILAALAVVYSEISKALK